MNILKNRNGRHPRIYRKFFLFFVPFSVIFGLLSFAVFYLQYVKPQREVLQTKELISLKLQNSILLETIKSCAFDLQLLASNPSLIAFVNTGEAKEEKSLEAELISFSKYKGIYDQVRILDISGMEIIRIDLEQNQPYVVPKEKLQFKDKRYYFTDTIRLDYGEIFMSPLDLNIERGVVERPLKPMIRFGMPLFDSTGEKKGALILNYLGEKMLNRIRTLDLNTIGKVQLVNSEGYWLKGISEEENLKNP